MIESTNKKSAGSSKAANGQSQSRGPGKRKKKRASYLSAYEENFRMDTIDTGKNNIAKRMS